MNAYFVYRIPVIIVIERQTKDDHYQQMKDESLEAIISLHFLYFIITFYYFGLAFDLRNPDEMAVYPMHPVTLSHHHHHHFQAFQSSTVVTGWEASERSGPDQTTVMMVKGGGE